MRMRVFFFLLISAAPVLYSADNAVGVARLGTIFDPAVKGIRILTGIPGAATMAGRVDIGTELSLAVVSPALNYSLGVAAGDSGVLILTDNSGTFSARSLEIAAPGPDRIAISPSGASAAFYYRGTSKALVVAGFPSAPKLLNEFDLSTLSADLTALAVSDDGQLLLTGSSDESGGIVYLWSNSGASRQVATAGHATAVSFARNSHNAWFADRVRNAILEMRDGKDFAPMTVPTAGLAGPFAVDVSADARKLIVANGGDNSIVVIDIKSGDSSVVPCNCSISGLRRMAGNATFSLTDPADRVVWIFDGDSPQPRMIFVPEASSK